jgi:hypothetical protein
MIMALPLGFVACGGDDDEEETWGQDINPIEGTWVSEDGKWRFQFTSDFKRIVYDWNTATEEWEYSYENEYKINEKSFKVQGTVKPFYYRMENDFLYINDNNNNWDKFFRDE